MTKPKTSKLVLRKDTLRQLMVNELTQVNGGEPLTAGCATASCCSCYPLYCLTCDSECI